MEQIKFTTDCKCPVCKKEIMVDDVLDLGFIRRAKSQPDLLEACETAFSTFACDAVRRVTSDVFYTSACRALQDAIAKAQS